jgi:C4-dicarboxylate-specific signal transduction histidine kinase
VQFREISIWEQYFWEMLLAAVVIVLQSVFIAVLLYEHQRRHAAEVECRQRMAELAHLNRQTTAGELSASIAHELNQPLGAILSNAETAELMLKSQVPNLEEITAILADIKRADLRATEVIQRLRRLLTKSHVERRNIDLNEIVGEVIGILARQSAAQNVTVNTVLTPYPLTVKGDRVQMEQVILNLVANAIDAIAKSRSDNRRITVRTHLTEDDTAELSVSDTGPGIPPDVLKQIFEPFFTTKESGMGMGLAIAHTIAKAHDGRLWAENQTGGGAIFRLAVPVVRARIKDKDAPPESTL